MQVGKQGHLAAHGFAGREIAVHPQVALVEERLLPWPSASVPGRVALVEQNACIATVTFGPGLCTVEGRLPGVDARRSVVASGGVGVLDVALPQSRCRGSAPRRRAGAA